MKEIDVENLDSDVLSELLGTLEGLDDVLESIMKGELKNE